MFRRRHAFLGLLAVLALIMGSLPHPAGARSASGFATNSGGSNELHTMDDVIDNAGTLKSSFPGRSAPGGTPPPAKPGQVRAAGNIPVYANSFTDTNNGWRAAGVIWIGDYTIVEGATVTFNNGALGGSGVVSLLSSPIGSERTELFKDGFTVDLSTGILTQSLANANEFRLESLAGFAVQNTAASLSVLVIHGVAYGTINVRLVIPGNNVVKAFGFTLYHTGEVGGLVEGVEFTIGVVKLTVRRATLSGNGFTINDALVTLPATLGGAGAELSVGDARITADGDLTLNSGSVTINFPNIHVGGVQGFGIEGARATLAFKNGTYLFSGAGTFSMPGVGAGECALGTAFTLASTPPPIRQAKLSLSGCFRVPLGTTGFFLTGVSGEVNLTEVTVAVDVSIDIAGGPTIPGFGDAVSGTVAAHWDNSWAVGLKGNVRIFKKLTANASVNVSQRDGFIGTLQISLAGVIEGNGRVHIWSDNTAFHFTGHADVKVRVPAGVIDKCFLFLCIRLPEQPVEVGNAGADFGEFRVNGNASAYGLKGSVRVLGFNPSFYIDVDGRADFKLGSFDEYALIDQRPLAGFHPDVAPDMTYTFEVTDSRALFVALAADKGDLLMMLEDPNGDAVQATDDHPDVTYTETITQSMLTVPNPMLGTWKVTITNREGDEHYMVYAAGAPVAPTTPVRPTFVANPNGYTIAVQATGAPTATYSLFYSTNNTNNDGKPIATGIPLSQTSVQWDTGGVPNGSYYIYVMVDDPFNAPLFTYSTGQITINDTTKPEQPAIESIRVLGSNAIITWKAGTSKDVVGYRITYREPGNGKTFVADVPYGNATSHTQRGLYLKGDWTFTVSAYDVNENDSPPTQPRTVSVGNTLYLPTIRR